MGSHETLRLNRQKRIAPANTLHDLCKPRKPPPDTKWSIQQMYARVLRLVTESPKSAAMLAGEIKVPQPYIYRYITALRRQGYDVVSTQKHNVTFFHYSEK